MLSCPPSLPPRLLPACCTAPAHAPPWHAAPRPSPHVPPALRAAHSAAPVCGSWGHQSVQDNAGQQWAVGGCTSNPRRSLPALAILWAHTVAGAYCSHSRRRSRHCEAKDIELARQQRAGAHAQPELRTCHCSKDACPRSKASGACAHAFLVLLPVPAHASV